MKKEIYFDFKELFSGVYFPSEAEIERAKEGKYSNWDSIKYDLLSTLDIVDYNLRAVDEVNEYIWSLLHKKDKLKKPRWYCVNLDEEKENGICYRDFRKYGATGRRLLLFNLEENDIVENAFKKQNYNWLYVDLDNDETVSTFRGKIEINTHRGPITGSRVFMLDLRDIALEYMMKNC